MDPNLNAVFSSIRSMLIVFGTILAGYGLTNSGLYFWIEASAGSIMVIGPAIWGVVSALSNYAKAHAVGVQAGINLTNSGAAIASDGKTVVPADSGATPPLPVTQKTAAEIVKDFGPSTPPAKV